MIGGEHLVTLGAVRAVAEKYPDLHIVHFDAHADLRDDYLGVKESHACVLHRCWDIVGDGKIYQFGIRSGDRDEFRFAKEHTFMEKFGFFRLDSIVKNFRESLFTLHLTLMCLILQSFPALVLQRQAELLLRSLCSQWRKLQSSISWALM